MFTTGRDAEPLVTRPKDLLDNATPSANSLAAVGAAAPAAPSPASPRYTERADGRSCACWATPATRHPTALGHLLGALDLCDHGATEIAVVGDRPDLVRAVTGRYLPNAVLAWGEPYPSPLWESRDAGTDGTGQAYVCRDFACQAPVDTPAALAAQL